MSRTDLFARWHGYQYFEYEKKLAVREIETQVGPVVRKTADGIIVRPRRVSRDVLQRLTYFQQFDGVNGSPVRTHQDLLEQSVRVDKPFARQIASRQQTRYSVHGIHDYKGKFNPQIVRAIANILSIKEGAAILDPFCGSGTSLVEAAYLGCNAIGLDMNPLAVFVANTKTAALRSDPDRLRRYSSLIAKQLKSYIQTLSHHDHVGTTTLSLLAGYQWRESICSYEYLSKWFSQPVLCQFALILKRIQAVDEKTARDFFLVVLSDIVRDVSLQDPADLRIRRRKDPKPNYPVLQLFLASLQKKVYTVSAALETVPIARGMQSAILSDARKPLRTLGLDFPAKGFCAAITSPPYVTALPYIDTQRLSLCLLGLLKSTQISAAERALIGGREITHKEKVLTEQNIRRNAAKLPRTTLALCRELLEAVNADRDGFRRMNTPGLAYRYFADMKAMFTSVAQSLIKGAPFALVVGRNKTSLGAKTYVIETPTLLADVAESVGYRVEEVLDLDAYPRFGLHQRNGITTEKLVVLKTSQNRP